MISIFANLHNSAKLLVTSLALSWMILMSWYTWCLYPGSLCRPGHGDVRYLCVCVWQIKATISVRHYTIHW